MTKTDAQYKQDQRLRDKLLLEEIGFNSIEGVMSAIRGLDEHGLEQLHTVLFRWNKQDTQAASKARPQAKRTRKPKLIRLYVEDEEKMKCKAISFPKVCPTPRAADGGWACAKCGYRNNINHGKCHSCGKSRRN